jgi:hypothetical protein
LNRRTENTTLLQTVSFTKRRTMHGGTVRPCHPTVLSVDDARLNQCNYGLFRGDGFDLAAIIEAVDMVR